MTATSIFSKVKTVLQSKLQNICMITEAKSKHMLKINIKLIGILVRFYSLLLKFRSIARIIMAIIGKKDVQILRVSLCI